MVNEEYDAAAVRGCGGYLGHGAAATLMVPYDLRARRLEAIHEFYEFYVNQETQET